jgi:hypothetical protein
MQSMAFHQSSSALNGKSLYVEGDLLFQQRNVLPANAVRTVYNTAALNKTTSDPNGSFSWRNIISEYKSRNGTHVRPC